MSDTANDVELATAGQKFTKIEITSDGTAKGTKVLLNGKEIDNLACIDMSVRPKSAYYPVSLSYTTEAPSKAGEFSECHRYYLNPPDPMDRAVATIQVGDQPEHTKFKYERPKTRREILESM